ncbi:hypothetical protein AURDEDRAFT_182461 [Auricularia subglabra TFB-10046 SS5]|nr:hypothetical protein AURDEDRAFT_182461 [Auricularia subglabra TFB-10046 SS5]
MSDSRNGGPTSPIATKEELNKAPPTDDIWCAACGADEDDSDKLLRCGTCKNHFYCSAKCQKKDWNAHKHNCSSLPLGELAYLDPLDDEQATKLNEEVHRVALLLHEWEKAFDEQGRAARAEGKPFRASELPQTKLLLDLNLAPEYSSAAYKRLPPEHQTHPYRTPIVLLTRLFLIHLMTPSPSNTIAAVEQLRRTLATWQLPYGPGAQVWAPKFATRPGDLSPGEYAQLSIMAQTLNFLEWFKPAVKGDGNDGEHSSSSTQSPLEVPYSRRLVNVAIISKSLWNV